MPLNFGLPGSDSCAMSRVAAASAMLAKVGVYAVLRIGTLLGEDDAAAAMLGPILFYLGFATLLAGTIGVLAARQLRRLVSYTVIVSSGLLLATLGTGNEALTPPALFYFATSVLTTCAFFLLTGMTDRTRVAAEEPESAPNATAVEYPTPAYVAFGVREPQPYDTSEEVGAAIPAAMAFLGLMFVCCVLLVAGLPPLPSFVAKLALLSAALDSAPAGQVPRQTWLLIGGILGTGFAQLIALTRIGIRLFWGSGVRRTPRLRVLEAAPVAVLVLLSLALSAMSGSAMRFFEAAARSLHAPEVYTRIVLSKPGADQPSGGHAR